MTTQKKLLFILFAFILMTAAPDQTLSQNLRFDDRFGTLPKKKEKLRFAFESTSDWINGLEEDNKAEVIEVNIIRSENAFKIDHAGYQFGIKATVAAGTDRDPRHNFGSVAFNAKKHFKSFNAAAESKFAYSHHYRYNLSKLAFEKPFHFTKYTSLALFTKVGAVFMLDNSNNHASNGVFWSNGAKLETELKKLDVHFVSQIIADSGALVPGKSLRTSNEVSLLYRIYEKEIDEDKQYDRPLVHSIKVGPLVEHIDTLSGHSDHRSKWSYGFRVKIN